MKEHARNGIRAAAIIMKIEKNTFHSDDEHNSFYSHEEKIPTDKTNDRIKTFYSTADEQATIVYMDSFHQQCHY